MTSKTPSNLGARCDDPQPSSARSETFEALKQDAEHHRVEKRHLGEVHDDRRWPFLDDLGQLGLQLLRAAEIRVAVNNEHDRPRPANVLFLVYAEVFGYLGANVTIHDVVQLPCRPGFKRRAV